MSSNTYTLNLSQTEVSVLISVLAIAETRYTSDIKLFESNIDLSPIPQPQYVEALNSYKCRLSICESLTQKLINLPLITAGKK
ncbi:hypothetical protein L1267_01865 [Pseudoalteromonas sp. OFAV1]|uniref:hypothetical protein n=1 Tax=Pseudoalteromonas sp. OFAV1 TaxID=2908892 RepID=UPI001F433952|nr:hypothetical protein [Pseudoalteromonas sp. OFAV1]MCF2899154.1 hypothetical protein [Pseudoalteromonas sp. OFAV1]